MPLATSSAEKTPSQRPSKPLTTKWWYTLPGSAALSMSEAASVRGIVGGTTRCAGILGDSEMLGSSHRPTVVVRGLPSTNARSRSSSVRRARGGLSASPSTVAEVRPVDASSLATSPRRLCRSQAAVRCQSWLSSSPTQGPAQSGLARSRGEWAFVLSTTSKDDSTPTASMLPGNTTTRWSRSRAVMRAAASMSEESAVTTLSLMLPRCSFSQSAMQTELGTPLQKAWTASLGVTMP
mmetsp:Transcript_53828/g.156982  ORF Transcript_53828/g.156982 Transcript_53828/m.156982 type:complete len:237 (-) Transcript_53828:782-1492(-)